MHWANLSPKDLLLAGFTRALMRCNRCPFSTKYITGREGFVFALRAAFAIALAKSIGRRLNCVIFASQASSCFSSETRLPSFGGNPPKDGREDSLRCFKEGIFPAQMIELMNTDGFKFNLRKVLDEVLWENNGAAHCTRDIDLIRNQDLNFTFF